MGPFGRSLARQRVLLAASALAACLLLPNLGNMYLWQDEAETALVAATIPRYGYPSAWDGRSLVTQNAGRDSNDDHVWTWHPWLQFYAAAVSLSLLGADAFAARLPFALVGIASVALFHVFARRLHGSERTAAFATLLLTTSIPFLLHVRQARWYALAIFGTVWLLHAWLRMRDGERLAELQLVAASLFLFHSSYVTFLGTWGGLALHELHGAIRGRPPVRVRPLVGSLGAILLCTVPWVVFIEGWKRENRFEAYATPFLERVLGNVSTALVDIDSYLFPLVLAPVLIVIARRSHDDADGDARSGVALLLAVCIATLLLLSVMPWIYFRYAIGLVPVCAALLALVVAAAWERHAAAGAALLAVLILSNAFSLVLPPRELRSDLLSYLYELTHDYDGPNEAIARYLLRHGSPDQLVLTNYGQLPIMFHTGMRAVGFGQDPRIAEEPDWIIARRHAPHRAYLLWRARGYEAIELDAPDLAYGNRPDPFYHKYRTVHDAPRVIVHRRRSAAPRPPQN